MTEGIADARRWAAIGPLNCRLCGSVLVADHRFVWYERWRLQGTLRDAMLKFLKRLRRLMCSPWRATKKSSKLVFSPSLVQSSQAWASKWTHVPSLWNTWASHWCTVLTFFFHLVEHPYTTGYLSLPVYSVTSSHGHCWMWLPNNVTQCQLEHAIMIMMFLLLKNKTKQLSTLMMLAF